MAGRQKPRHRCHHYRTPIRGPEAVHGSSERAVSAITSTTPMRGRPNGAPASCCGATRRRSRSG